MRGAEGTATPETPPEIKTQRASTRFPFASTTNPGAYKAQNALSRPQKAGGAQVGRRRAPEALNLFTTLRIIARFTLGANHFAKKIKHAT